MNAKFQSLGPIIIFICCLIPLLLWFPNSNWITAAQVLRSLGQAAALSGAILLSINFILSTRFRFIESLFMGLNRVFINHHLVGAFAFILLLFHPALLILSYLTISLDAAASLLLPSWENLANIWGGLALLVMTILLVITFYVNLRYETWKKTHQWLGLGLLLAFLHTLIIPSTISTNLVLRYYILSFIVVALASFIFRLVVKFFRLSSLPYLVSEIQVLKDIVLIKMTPVGKSVHFVPGQFVFTAFKRIGIRSESHPFSITSKPSDNFLSIATKVAGDYTETLKLLTPGTQVFIEGAYGRFSYKYYKNPKQLWIAGGIGITPFLSMLKEISGNYDINFYYLVSEQNEAVFDSEIKSIVSSKSSIKYKLHVSKTEGHLEVRNLAQTYPGIGEYEIFICGPAPMMKSLKKQFKELGVRSSHIHTEEFSLN